MLQLKSPSNNLKLILNSRTLSYSPLKSTKSTKKRTSFCSQIREFHPWWERAWAPGATLQRVPQGFGQEPVGDQPPWGQRPPHPWGNPQGLLGRGSEHPAQGVWRQEAHRQVHGKGPEGNVSGYVHWPKNVGCPRQPRFFPVFPNF